VFSSVICHWLCLIHAHFSTRLNAEKQFLMEQNRCMKDCLARHGIAYPVLEPGEKKELLRLGALLGHKVKDLFIVNTWSISRVLTNSAARTPRTWSFIMNCGHIRGEATTFSTPTGSRRRQQPAPCAAGIFSAACCVIIIAKPCKTGKRENAFVHRESASANSPGVLRLFAKERASNI
jgi:hypothetical protein